MTMTQQLPSTLHELIRVALDDLKACESDPNYIINMNRWHEIPMYNNKCHACLAGSVMAKSLGADIRISLSPKDYNDDIGGKLRALDKARTGNIAEALSYFHGLHRLHFKHTNINKIIVTYEYKENQAYFFQYMNSIADRLEEYYNTPEFTKLIGEIK